METKFGENRLFNGDIRETLKEFPEETFDLLVTDCPYLLIAGGVMVDGEDGFKSDGSLIGNKWIKAEKEKSEYYIDTNGVRKRRFWKERGVPSAVKDGKMFEHNSIKFSDWLPEVFRVLKKGTHAFIMVNARNLSQLQIEAEKSGFVYQNILVWRKQNKTPNKYYMQNGEFILMLSKRPARDINNLGSETCFEIAPNDTETFLLHFENKTGDKIHPTQKPVELMKVLIENSSNENDLILDPFMGSCPTGIACMQSHRRFVGIDIDSKYYDLAVNRMTAFLNEKVDKPKATFIDMPLFEL